MNQVILDLVTTDRNNGQTFQFTINFLQLCNIGIPPSAKSSIDFFSQPHFKTLNIEQHHTTTLKLLRNIFAASIAAQ
ncbi:hypothetical protein D7S70_03040 [Ralstonia pickettii]|nr:hypothetical protein [Ralstonia pickettii]MBB0033160.1 hypothetical protein [Ralstonia pickettii]MBB0095369.1 hypothetical protein [Ralstonia pickettii]MBB0105628.1 hypothetical protein [Ralstonia pickettii]MBB0126809.1 hypothetical protein [Ralstonia pickettii]